MGKTEWLKEALFEGFDVEEQLENYHVLEILNKCPVSRPIFEALEKGISADALEDLYSSVCENFFA